MTNRRGGLRPLLATAIVGAMLVAPATAPLASASTTSYSAKAVAHNWVKAFAVGPDGTQHLLTDVTGATGALYVSDHDGVWQTHAFSGESGDLALDPDGNPVIALRGGSSFGFGIVGLATESDGVWTVEDVDPTLGPLVGRVRLAIGTDGTAFVAYGDDTGILYRVKPPGGSWSAAHVVDAPTRPPMTFGGGWDMVLDDADTPHFVVSGHYPSSPIDAPCVVDGGCTVDMVPDGVGWSVTPISGAAGIPDAIDTAATGLELTLNDNTQIQYVGKSGADWVTQDVISANAASSLTRGPDGPVILLTPSPSGLRRADRSGSVWTTSPVVSGRTTFPAADFDASGRLHVAYSLAYDDPILGETGDAYVRAPDDVAPTVGVPGVKGRIGATLGTKAPSSVGWTAADSQSGLDHYQIQQRTDGGSWSTLNYSLTVKSKSRDLSLGHVYEFRVRAYDKAGHASGWKQSLSAKVGRFQETSSVISYSGTWTTATSSTASGGKTRYTKSASAKATITFTGIGFTWVAPKSSSRGRADVWIDGGFVAEVDLHRSSGAPRLVVYAVRWTAPGTHTVEIRNLATSGHPRIDIDAILLTR